MYFITSVSAIDTANPFRISEVKDLESANTESFPASESPKASTIYVAKTSIISGSDVKLFSPNLDEDGKWIIYLTLTKAGADKFRIETCRLIGKQLAIILDGKLMSAPVLRAPIEDGMIVISGNFDEDWLVKMTSYFEKQDK